VPVYCAAIQAKVNSGYLPVLYAAQASTVNLSESPMYTVHNARCIDLVDIGKENFYDKPHGFSLIPISGAQNQHLHTRERKFEDNQTGFNPQPPLVCGTADPCIKTTLVIERPRNPTFTSTSPILLSLARHDVELGVGRSLKATATAASSALDSWETSRMSSLAAVLTAPNSGVFGSVLPLIASL